MDEEAARTPQTIMSGREARGRSEKRMESERGKRRRRRDKRQERRKDKIVRHAMSSASECTTPIVS